MKGGIHMPHEAPTVRARNAHYLKGHASWLYCDQCGKTMAYLCYVTYRYFRFAFTCACGSEGEVENRVGEVDLQSCAVGEPVRSAANKRFCCANDGAALFSPVPGHLAAYRAEVVCKACDTRYVVEERCAAPASSAKAQS